MIEKIIVVADNRRSNQHGFCRSFESIARSIIGFEQVFRALELDVDVEVFLQLSFNPRNVLDQ